MARLRQAGRGITLTGPAGGYIMLWDKFLQAVQIARFPGFIGRELHPTAGFRHLSLISLQSLNRSMC